MLGILAIAIASLLIASPDPAVPSAQGSAPLEAAASVDVGGEVQPIPELAAPAPLVVARTDVEGLAAAIDEAATPEDADESQLLYGASEPENAPSGPELVAVHAAGIPDLVLPVEGGRLSSPFGWRKHPVLGDRRFHKGIDLSLPRGSPVVAAANGVVTEVAKHRTYGLLVRIEHGEGWETVYAHLDRFASGLQAGDKVRQGQRVAFVGRSGLSTGSHLYWELRLNGVPQDPLERLDEEDRERIEVAVGG